jgi:hypothetical protein
LRRGSVDRMLRREEISMKKIVLTYGCISGVVIAVLMNASVLFAKRIGYGHSMILGYTIMVASFLLVYFGIRSYRDTVGGGVISFGRAMGVGSLIMLITCMFYVVSWEIVYYNFMPHFMDDYGAYVLEKAKAAGATAAQLAAKQAEVDKTKQMYASPLMNSLMTFMEPLPVGVLITLISAALLRRKSRAGSVSEAQPA